MRPGSAEDWCFYLGLPTLLRTYREGDLSGPCRDGIRSLGLGCVLIDAPFTFAPIGREPALVRYLKLSKAKQRFALFF